MAGRTRNRHELRRQAEAAEQRAKESGAEPRAPRGRTRAGQVTARVCARWGVYDASMKRVEAFDFKDKAKAEARVAELNALRRGSYVLQMFKEEIVTQGDGLE